MGDLANMTNVHGEVDGFRLLRWLRSRLVDEQRWTDEAASGQRFSTVVWHTGRADLLQAMADDLEQELTPPDYPDDDGDGVDLDGKDTGPCEMCAKLADRVPVRVRGFVLFACPDCAARASGDTVNLDDSALTGGP